MTIIYNEQEYESILLSETPSDIIVEDISRNRCTNNSKKIAEDNVGVEYVEGILLVDAESGMEAFPHAWNRKGSNHFDVTFELIADKAAEVKAQYYFPYFVADCNELVTAFNGVVEFTKHSKPFLIEIRDRYKKNTGQ